MRRKVTSLVIAVVLGMTGILIAQSTVVINPQVTGSWPGGRIINSLTWQTDNTADIGASGANRPRHVYIAGNYYGNGATLTGITGATGGVSNTGSTSIASDSDASGSEDIAFLTSTATRWLVKGGTGHLLPNVNTAYNLGAPAMRVFGVYAGTFSNGNNLAAATYSAQLTVGTKAFASAQLSGETSDVSIIDLATTWNNAANTPSAIKLNVTDTASNAGSLLMDLQVGGASKLMIRKDGQIASGQSIYAAMNMFAGTTGMFGWPTRATMYSPADGVILLQNNAATGFTQLQFGGGTDSFPSLYRSGTTLTVYTAGLGGYSTFQAGRLQALGVSPSVMIGDYGAQSGALRLQNNEFVKSRNAANSADLSVIGLNASNQVSIAADGSTTLLGGPLTITGGTITSDLQALSLTQTWNNAGVTFTAIKLNVTDTASDAASRLLDLQVGGASKFSVDKAGTGAFTHNISVGGNTVYWGGFGRISANANGVVAFYDSAGTSFSRLQFGGTTSSYPALKRNGSGIDVRLADDSNYTTLTAGALSAAGNLLYFGSYGSIYATGDGVFTLRDNVATSFGRLNFGGTTSSFPALKRSAAALHLRAADDSTTADLVVGSFESWGTAYVNAALRVGGANTALAGSIRITNNTAINWRNAANSADLGLTLNGSNVLVASMSAISIGTTPASAGEIRLPFNTGIRFRNGANDGDILALETLTGGDVLYINRGGSSYVAFGGSGVGFGASFASAGIIRLPNNAQINWRNQANGADIGGFYVGTDDGLYVGNAVTPASSGTRYLCISTTGKITSSATACSGT